MPHSNYSFLKDRFKYTIYSTTSESSLTSALRTHFNDPELIDSFPYAISLIETTTGEPITFMLTTDEKPDCSSFEFYLNQLPDLNLNNVTLLLALSMPGTQKQVNIFQFPSEYPSTFAKELLQETYGKLVYDHQFENLIRTCLPQKEQTKENLSYYRKAFNKRQCDFFKKAKTLFLPDNTNLYVFLKDFTPVRESNMEFGFVTTPNHKEAFRFSELVNQ
ncbi:MAG: hypothetical protein WD530_00340 [Vicingaceae bacterium]